MNRIEKLLEEMCPEGVEFRRLGDIFDLRNGYTPSKSNTSFWRNGSIPWFRMEDIRANGRVLSDSIQYVTKSAIKGGRLFPANSIIVATSATIGEHALVTIPHLTNQRFTCLSLKKEFKPVFEIKFLFYYCFMLGEWCCNNINASSFASVDMQGFREFKFPIPPLEIQTEIIKILDKFVKLQAELQAELQARKIQYGYYRNALLTFPQHSTAQHSTAQHSTAQHSTAQHSTAQHKMLLFFLGCVNCWINIVRKEWHFIELKMYAYR